MKRICVWMMCLLLLAGTAGADVVHVLPLVTWTPTPAPTAAPTEAPTAAPDSRDSPVAGRLALWLMPRPC